MWRRNINPLHIAFALNPKWYEPKIGMFPPDNDKMRHMLMKAFQKMYLFQQSYILYKHGAAFSILMVQTSAQARMDRAVMEQKIPMVLAMHELEAPELRTLAIWLLLQVQLLYCGEESVYIWLYLEYQEEQAQLQTSGEVSGCAQCFVTQGLLDFRVLTESNFMVGHYSRKHHPW